jgi:hypothetical protein
VLEGAAFDAGGDGEFVRRRRDEIPQRQPDRGDDTHDRSEDSEAYANDPTAHRPLPLRVLA